MSRGNRTNHARGMAHPMATLSDEQVLEMRRRRATETPRPSYLTLALDFDCGESTARRICRGETRV